MTLRCADLFCGAGGFSEGFRQAGLEVVSAYDLWPPAFVTHKKNHGGAHGIRDVQSLRPRDLRGIDVLIGSPPCTEFSFANRGGNGDLEAGLQLVRSFLRLVYLVRPRWWVMENVPRMMSFLGTEVPLRELGINRDGSLRIPVRELLASADYGAPQQRVRAFFGNFPVPRATHREHGNARWRTLRDVLEGLGDPQHAAEAESEVRDPVYGFILSAGALTDHYSQELRLAQEEIREVRKAKVDHSWYGKMSFPDDLDRPARTVMATQLRVSRETIVVPSGDGGYRRLSVREMASCMGFPITYQFWGRTNALRAKLVGNAVAPPVAFAIASEIARAAGMSAPSRPQVRSFVGQPAPAVAGATRRRRLLPIDRRFREHVPGSKVPGFRVDLDNQGTRQNGHPVGWRAVLFRGSGKSLGQEAIDLSKALRLFRSCVPERDTRRFIRGLEGELEGVPDATTLQRIRAELEDGDITPHVLLERIAKVVAHQFGHEEATRRNGGPLPPRIAATLVATAYACALANEHPRRPPLRLAASPLRASASRSARASASLASRSP